MWYMHGWAEVQVNETLKKKVCCGLQCFNSPLMNACWAGKSGFCTRDIWIQIQRPDHQAMPTRFPTFKDFGTSETLTAFCNKYSIRFHSRYKDAKFLRRVHACLRNPEVAKGVWVSIDRPRVCAAGALFEPAVILMVFQCCLFTPIKRVFQPPVDEYWYAV